MFAHKLFCVVIFLLLLVIWHGSARVVIRLMSSDSFDPWRFEGIDDIFWSHFLGMICLAFAVVIARAVWALAEFLCGVLGGVIG